MAITLQETMNKVCGAALYVASEASIGYLCAHLFTKLNPMRCAGLFATSCLVSTLMQPLYDTLFARYESSLQTRFVGALINHGVSIIVTTAVASLAGCPITLATGAALACYSIGAHILLAAAYTVPVYQQRERMA